MSDRSLRWGHLALAAYVVLHFGVDPASTEAADPCVDRRLFAGERAARAELRCYSKAAAAGENTPTLCVERARERVRTDLAVCASDDASEVVEIVEAFVWSVVTTVWTPTVGSACSASKLAAIETATTSFIETEREHLSTGQSRKRARLRSRAWRVLNRAFDRADGVAPCADRPNVVVAALDDLAAALRRMTRCSAHDADLIREGWYVAFGVAELDSEYLRLLETRNENPFGMELWPDDDGVGFSGQMSWRSPYLPWPIRGVMTCDGSIFFEKERSISLPDLPIWGIVDGDCIRGMVAHGPPGAVWVPWAALRWGSAGCD